MLGATVALMVCAEASADALRCGHRVISRGDHAAKLLRYCGEPVAVQSRVVQRTVAAFGAYYVPGLGLLEDVVVEEWTYNFGPRKLMRQVRIEKGLIEEVRELGYGFRPK
jgi:hypothetical protein